MNAIAINPPNHLPQNGGSAAADYHARDKTLVTREEFRAEMAELRKDIRNLYRLMFVGFIGGGGIVISGIIAIIVKLYFGA